MKNSQNYEFGCSKKMRTEREINNMLLMFFHDKKSPVLKHQSELRLLLLPLNLKSE